MTGEWCRFILRVGISGWGGRKAGRLIGFLTGMVVNTECGKEKNLTKTPSRPFLGVNLSYCERFTLESL